MNLEKRFKLLTSILSQHQRLLDQEVLESYPRIPAPYLGWVQSMRYFSDEDLIGLENLKLDGLQITNAYHYFLNEVKQFSILPQFKGAPQEIPKHLLRKLTLKKRHELSLLKSQLHEGTEFIDIGSGAGHLSGILLDGNKKRSLCIDLDAKVQEIGKEKYEYLAPRLKFKTLEFGAKTPLLTHSGQTLVGLHACGDLSVELMDFFSLHPLKELLNFPCCYHKLTRTHLSKEAQKNPVNLSDHALTMAAKSYKQMSQSEFDRRNQVKRFRYTLHFIMVDHLDIPFRSLGNGAKQDYKSSFADYCYKYLPESKQFTSERLEELFISYEETYRSYLLFGIIRSHLSRLVELYICIDRALYLKEQGFEVMIEEVFNRKISPRNIALRAYAKRA